MRKELTTKGLIVMIIILATIVMFDRIDSAIRASNKSSTNHNTPTESTITSPTINEETTMSTENQGNLIYLIINDQTFDVILEDNATARVLTKKLPLDITMAELNGNEKYYYFDDALPNNPIRINQIHTGDIMLYGNNCIVLFYDTFDTTYTYTRIGRINNPGNLKNLVGSENITIRLTK